MVRANGNGRKRLTPAPRSAIIERVHPSGAVEGACKNLVRDRMERSGMRWSPLMAEAMLKLRAVYLSDDLDAYWTWHIERDQQRLYPKDHWHVVLK